MPRSRSEPQINAEQTRTHAEFFLRLSAFRQRKSAICCEATNAQRVMEESIKVGLARMEIALDP